MTRGRPLARLGSRLLAGWGGEAGAATTSASRSSSSSLGSSGGPLGGSGGGQHQQRRYAGQVLADPVSLPRGTLLAGGMALLAGGAALGAQIDRFARQVEHQQQQAPVRPGLATAVPAMAPASSSSSGGGASWLSEVLPSLLSHSQARPLPAERAATAAGFAPLSGCLSPFFISDAAAKAAPAVVNITVAGGGVLPVGSSGSGFIVDAVRGLGAGAEGRADRPHPAPCRPSRQPRLPTSPAPHAFPQDGTILTNAHVVSDAIQRQHANGAAPGAGGLLPRGITVTLQARGAAGAQHAEGTGHPAVLARAHAAPSHAAGAGRWLWRRLSGPPCRPACLPPTGRPHV